MRAIGRVVAAFLLVTTLIHVFPGSAQAGIDVSCVPPSSIVVTYDPPLTNQPQTVSRTASIQYGPCVSVSHPALTSGTTIVGGTVTTSCVELLRANTFVQSITWNTGETSTISGNRSVSIVGGTVTATSTGTVTAGLFTGSTFVQEAAGVATDIVLCTAGLGTVPSLYNTITMTMTSM
jgi:hypothetical protein